MNFISIFLCLCFLILLSDAKFRKDVLKDFVGGDGAAGGDGTESVDDLADLFAQQVGGKPVAQAVESPVESLAGRREGFVMAAVRNDRIAVVECVGIDCPAQGFAQPVETRALFRRDADDVFGKRQRRGSPVDFVCDGQELLIGTEREIGLGNRGCEGRSVNQVDDELRPPDALHRAFDAHAFEPVVGRPPCRGTGKGCRRCWFAPRSRRASCRRFPRPSRAPR